MVKVVVEPVHTLKLVAVPKDASGMARTIKFFVLVDGVSVPKVATTV